MTLTNIEYGSIASSEILNNNFKFLEEKIDGSEDKLNTDISSILSNIATINTRLTELSESLIDAIGNFESNISEVYSKMTIAINKVSLIPNWSNLYSVSSLAEYLANANGYLLITSIKTDAGTLTINDEVIEINNDNLGTDVPLLVLPIKENDVVKANIVYDKCYFLPTSKFSLEG